MDPTDPRPLDILDGDFYVANPYPKYAWMRDNEPVMWDEVNELWCIAKYDDIIAIEKNKQLFINSDQNKGGYRPNLPADQSIIALDDPLHTARRRLVARRFTPRAVNDWEGHIREVVVGLFDQALSSGRPDGESEGDAASCDVDIVDQLAAPLPATMIGLLLGYPAEMTRSLQDWSERTIALGGGPRYMNVDGATAAIEFAGACAELYEAKKTCPADDVMSLWIDVEKQTNGEVGGHPFGLDQIISDCLLLLDGGAETTRTVIARALLALADQPALWAQLQSAPDLALAAEEFIRWVTPIHNFCRVATADVEMRGKTIRAGQQVLLMYASANRDPEHFEDPESIVIDRDPNHHLSFGFGTHFCLGASLARLEIQIFLEQLVSRVSSLERLTSRPHIEQPNAFVYGLKESHLRLTPA